MKQNTYDIMIVAAGNGTRMGPTSIPKVLTPINGVPNLINTLKKIDELKFVNNVYIVVNKRNFHQVVHAVSMAKNIISVCVKLIEIESGRGDGHAVLEASKQINNLTEWFFVMWGDAYLTSHEIFNDCVMEKFNNSQIKNPMFIPVVNEKEPYVTFIVDKDMTCLAADFSKRGEHHPTGFHDQCVFFCSNIILEALNILESAYFKNGRYVTDSGELTFLYLVHYLYNSQKVGAKAIITDSPVLSYNTAGEVKDIEKILNNE